jgi:hypothetical protein
VVKIIVKISSGVFIWISLWKINENRKKHPFKENLKGWDTDKNVIQNLQSWL